MSQISVWDNNNNQKKEVSINDEEIESIMFGKKALDFIGSKILIPRYGPLKTVAHYFVVVKTKNNKLLIIHNTVDKNRNVNFVIVELLSERDLSKFEIDFEIDCKKDLKDQQIKISEIYKECESNIKCYQLHLNNCIHARNRIKQFIRKKLKDEKKEKEKYLQDDSSPCVLAKGGAIALTYIGTGIKGFIKIFKFFSKQKDNDDNDKGKGQGKGKDYDLDQDKKKPPKENNNDNQS